MKTPHVTGTAVALAATSLLALGPVAFADENTQPVPAASAAQLSTLAQTAEENTSIPTAEDQKPAEEETPEPIEVIPVPTPSDDAEPTPAPSEPAEPSPEPTEPPEETPGPIEVVPVPSPEPSEQPSEPAEPTPEPVESETATAEPTAEPTADATVEPSADPSESDNAPVPVETIAPTSSALAEEAAPEASAEAVPVQVDAEQNILLTGTVTQEQTTETGETIVVTEEVTAAGEQVTTEFVVNPAEGQTTVTQTVTNPATGEKKTTERKVPATTFKAGGAASIEAASSPSRKSATAPLLLGIAGALGITLAAAGIILYRRQATTAS